MPANFEFRKRQIYGLLLLAILLLIAGVIRARPHTLFPPGWWRAW